MEPRNNLMPVSSQTTHSPNSLISKVSTDPSGIPSNAASKFLAMSCDTLADASNATLLRTPGFFSRFDTCFCLIVGQADYRTICVECCQGFRTQI